MFSIASGLVFLVVKKENFINLQNNVSVSEGGVFETFFSVLCAVERLSDFLEERQAQTALDNGFWIYKAHRECVRIYSKKIQAETEFIFGVKGPGPFK
jgi:hypothetical protein